MTRSSLGSSLLRSAYTIVESTTHSLAIDVLTDPANDIGTLFLSDADGIYFVEALANTNRNDAGYVDYESLVGLEGIGLANVVRNAQDVLVGREEKKVMSLMTYDDGMCLDRVARSRPLHLTMIYDDNQLCRQFLEPHQTASDSCRRIGVGL